MKLVLCCGCFDILHVGHVLHLQAARALGERLVVALTGDRFVNKGPGRPVHTQQQRELVLRALRCVDDVVVYEAQTPAAVIQAMKPDIYCKGVDYVGQRLLEQDLVESLGGRVVFTTTPKHSSTALVEKMR